MGIVVPAYSLVAPHPPPPPRGANGCRSIVATTDIVGERIDTHSLNRDRGTGDGVFFVWPVGTWGQPVLSHGHGFYVLASVLVV